MSSASSTRTCHPASAPTPAAAQPSDSRPGPADRDPGRLAVCAATTEREGGVVILIAGGYRRGCSVTLVVITVQLFCGVAGHAVEPPPGGAPGKASPGYGSLFSPQGGTLCRCAMPHASPPDVLSCLRRHLGSAPGGRSSPGRRHRHCVERRAANGDGCATDVAGGACVGLALCGVGEHRRCRC